MLNELTGCEVEVITPDILYRGKLVEVNETEVHLQAENGWIVIPVDKVVEVKAAE